MIDPLEYLRNSRIVGDHAHCPHDLGQIATGDDSWGLIIDSALESSGAPVDELDSPLCLDGGYRGANIPG